MKFYFEDMPTQRIAYMRKVGPYGAGNNVLMERLKEWAAEKGLFHASAIILGIAQDNPAFVPPANCRYDAGIVVAEDFRTPDEAVQVTVLPGGRYAVFMLQHTAEAMQEAWGSIFSELSAQGCPVDTFRPILERYMPGMVVHHLCEICIPVVTICDDLKRHI